MLTPDSLTTLHAPADAAQWLRTRVTGNLSADSRSIGAGDGFVAWPGAATDGRRFVAQALAQGAAGCLVEHEGLDAFGFDTAQASKIASYPQLKAATGPIASAYYDHPSHQLDVLAVTGTNGKTSTAWWLAQALSNMELLERIPSGLVGTLGMGLVFPGHLPALTPTGMTTPDPVLLQGALADWVNQGVKTCALEASSIGLQEGRLDGTRIRVALFTNFTQDHLDYHGNMDAYWQAKRALFDWPGLQAAVLNVDDAHGARLAATLQGRHLDVWTVSCETPARLLARHIRYEAGGLRFDVLEDGQALSLQTRLIGQYNVSNLLGVIAALRALGHPLARALQACAALAPVPGRMECLGGTSVPLVAVDYAHTPDALNQALLALKPLVQQRGGQLWCVFGCGGDRDASKRPLMGGVAQRASHRVVITSDNPRHEKPLAIIEQIFMGMKSEVGVTILADRASAIAYALAEADARDVVLVAGKGHEGYQDAAGVKHPFSDQAHVLAALQARGLKP